VGANDLPAGPFVGEQHYAAGVERDNGDRATRCQLLHLRCALIVGLQFSSQVGMMSEEIWVDARVLIARIVYRGEEGVNG
jgi:hypothetical protein